MRNLSVILLILITVCTSWGRKIPDRAYAGDTTITSFTIKSDISEIGEAAFEGCKNLQTIIFEENSSLKDVGKRCFAWCENLESIELPSGLLTIGTDAFIYCFNLKWITLPPGLTKIGMNAFSFCKSLSEITIPSSVNTIGSYAFSSCSNLRHVTLPDNPSILGELIFASCLNIESITELSPIPPAFECNSFLIEPDETDIYRKCTLYIKTESESVYSSSPGWRLFSKITADR